MQNKKSREYLTVRAIEREKRMDRITTMLLAVLFLFLVNEIPQSVLIILTIVYGKRVFSDCYTQMGDILDILALVNSSLHLFLYYALSRQYRASLNQFICKRKPERRKCASNTVVSSSTRL